MANMCIGIMLCITWSPSRGVEILTGVIIDAAILFSLLATAFFVGCLSICPQTSIPYVNL